MQHARLSKVSLSYLIAVRQGVVARRFLGKAHAFRLYLDGNKSRTGHSPRADHSHRPYAAAKVERGPRRRTPARAVPGGEDVVGGEAVSVPQLEQSEMSADGVQRFVRFDRKADVQPRGNRPRLRPAFEMRLVVHSMTGLRLQF